MIFSFLDLKEVLCKEYEYRASNFQPLPWIDKMQFKLKDVYTKLTVVKRKKCGWEKTNKIVEPSDMFDDEDEESNPRIILIEGSPGTGKTTLSLKLAYDWAMGQMPDKFPEVELVLLIKCRDMKDSIQESAKTQLLPWDKDELRNVLDSFLHSTPDKIMLIVDGVDEISEENESHVFDLLKRGCLRDCYVVLTSRQEKGMEVRKYCDKLLEIKGYSGDSRNNYINKYFESNIDLAKKLQEKIETNAENNLQTLAMNPLNTLLLCVVFGDNDGNLPTTVTELYQNIVECIWKRYCKKKRPEEKDISFEIAKQTLGRLAYESLIEHDTLYFRENKLRGEEIRCTNIGFLYKDDISTKILKPDNTYWFLHKTFQEYFAAYHCVYTKSKIDMSKLSDYTRKGGAKFIQVLKFMSSMLQKKNAKDHIEFIKQLGCFSPQTHNDYLSVRSILCTVLSENDLDKDIAGTVKTFIPKNLTFNARSSREPYNRYFLKVMPRILNLLGTEVKDEDNQKVELETLAFCHVRNGTEWLKLICEALMKNLVVDTMIFRDCKLEVNYLAQILSENSSVRILYVSNNSITNEGVNILAKSLCKNSTLKSLNLFENDLGFHNESASQFTDMAEMLARNDKLEDLNLSDNPLGSHGVTWIAKALESNKGVKRLYLNKTDCGDEGAAALAKMLAINETLECLYLFGSFTYDNDNDSLLQNNIGDEGATALADVLKEHNSSLRELHLYSNEKITDKGLNKLTETVQKNKALTLYIDFPEQNKTDDEETMERIKPGNR